MTTIVYDHENQRIAVDSRTSSGSYIVTDNEEKFTYDGFGRLWFLTGVNCDCQPFIDSYEHNAQAPKDLFCHGIFVKDKRVFLVTLKEGLYKTTLCKNSECWGSGADFAMSALDLCYSATVAMDCAKKRDSHTGGLTRVYDIEKGEFISDTQQLVKGVSTIEITRGNGSAMNC